MDFLKPPGPLSSAGEISKNWQTFKQRFEFFLAASEPTDKPRTEPCKTALLLSVAGEEAIEIFNTFSFGEDENKNDYATIVKKFDEYCAAQKNEVHERYVFRTRVQVPGTGCVERVYRMVLRDEARPVVQAARRVPLALQEPLRGELGRMERAGIITKVTEPTDWKAIGEMPPRLQRFFLRLLRYDIKLQFTPGKQLLLADMLSRATTATSAENDVTNDDTEVHAINSNGIRTITWRGTSRKKTADNVARRPAVSK